MTSLRDLEHIARKGGVEILHTELGPHIYGATTRTLGTPLIVLHPRLNPWHREFTLAHEFEPVQLHLPGLPDADPLSPPTTGGIEDIEADTFAVVYLLWQVPKQQQVPQVLQYVLTNPDTVRRT